MPELSKRPVILPPGYTLGTVWSVELGGMARRLFAQGKAVCDFPQETEPHRLGEVARVHEQVRQWTTRLEGAADIERTRHELAHARRELARALSRGGAVGYEAGSESD